MIVDTRCRAESSINIISVSGGKDSLAQWLVGIESGVHFFAGFCRHRA